MKRKIKSSTIYAQNAIGELVGVDASDKQNQQVEFSYTTEITGMETGHRACNQKVKFKKNEKLF